MPRDLRQIVVRLTSILMSLSVATIAIWNIATTSQYGRYLALDALLAENKPVLASAVSDAASGLLLSLDSCRTDIWEAVLNITMQNLAEEQRKVDRVAWIVSLVSAERLLKDALVCMPTNSTVWARLANVRWSRGGSAEEQAYLLAMSQAYSPAELDPLRMRIAQWQQVSPRVLIMGARTLKADIGTLLRYAPIELIKEVLPAIPPSLTAVIRDELRLVSSRKREGLVSQGWTVN